MKKMITQQFIRTTIFLLAIIGIVSTANAYDFEVGGIYYNITSSNTVEVTYKDTNFSCYFGQITIPNSLTFNGKNYNVTAIGDSAFFCCEVYGGDGESDYSYSIDYDVTIPETVTSIGYNAFGGASGLVNAFCLADTPPLMDRIGYGITNLFVSSEAFALYEELNNQYHFFDDIRITNGERSNSPIYKEELLYQPVDSRGPYGCAVKIFPRENSVIYLRQIYNAATGEFDHINVGEWEKYVDRDSIYFYYECEFDGTWPDDWEIEFFEIEEGKNPSCSVCCGGIGTHEEGGSFYDFRCIESFDFMDSNICYKFFDNDVAVTYEGYRWMSGEEKNSTNTNKLEIGVISEESTQFENSNDRFGNEYYSYSTYIYYSNEVVIPSSATYRNYYDDTYTSYPVTAIGPNAFMNCVDLINVTLPNTIKTIDNEAFKGTSRFGGC